MLRALVEAIADMREEDVIKLTDDLIISGTNPADILGAARDAMGIIGRRFESGECFIPELILAGEMLGQIAAKVKPMLQDADTAQKKQGRIVIGTVRGDIHNIGKDIVSFMLDSNGFEVIDLGVDVPVEQFVSAVKEFQPQIIALSGFLTLAVEQ
jgi:methanogenic corrinoid protein MtbC1